MRLLSAHSNATRYGPKTAKFALAIRLPSHDYARENIFSFQFFGMAEAPLFTTIEAVTSAKKNLSAWLSDDSFCLAYVKIRHSSVSDRFVIKNAI